MKFRACLVVAVAAALSPAPHTRRNPESTLPKPLTTLCEATECTIEEKMDLYSEARRRSADPRTIAILLRQISTATMATGNSLVPTVEAAGVLLCLLPLIIAIITQAR